jgi:hypothetical protein
MDKPLTLLCVVEDPAISPSSRLRIYKHLGALKEAGVTVEVMIQPKRGESWGELLGKARAVDAVLWQKVLMSQWNVLRLRHASKRLLFDLDDAVWMGKRNHVPYVSGKQARRFGFLTRFLDGAVCGSPFLERKILEIVPKCQTTVVPTSVPELPFKDHSVPHELPVIVWVGMGPNVSQIEEIEDELVAAQATHPFLLRVVSNRHPNFRRFSSWEPVTWSEAAEYDAIASADIGIMPLVDDGFTRGKCAYKALQYMACGLPVIASDVGVNREWIRDTGAGLVVTPGGWAAALGELLSSSSTREAMGRAGWELVRERFTDAVVGHQLGETLRRMIFGNLTR